MSSESLVRELIKELKNLENFNDKDDNFWRESGSNVLICTRQIILRTDKINTWIPNNFDASTNCVCLLKTFFIIIDNISEVNLPFRDETWNKFINESNSDDEREQIQRSETIYSFYELALAHFCALVSCLAGDRFKYTQALLIQQLFGSSDICSIFASDVYAFITRIINPIQKTALCQLIFNLCKIAPPKEVVRGAALMDRIIVQMDDKTKKAFQYRNRYPECLMHFLRE